MTEEQRASLARAIREGHKHGRSADATTRKWLVEEILRLNQQIQEMQRESEE